MLFVAGKVAVELYTEWKESQSFVPVGVSFIYIQGLKIYLKTDCSHDFIRDICPI